MLIRYRRKTVRDIEINTVRNKQRNRYRHKSEVKERISTFEMRSDTAMLANHVSTIKSIRVPCDLCIERKRFVCLSVLYAFYHRTTDFDEIFQEPPSHSGEGCRLRFVGENAILGSERSNYAADQSGFGIGWQGRIAGAPQRFLRVLNINLSLTYFQRSVIVSEQIAIKQIIYLVVAAYVQKNAGCLFSLVTILLL